jgi:hypothetical protein
LFVLVVTHIEIFQTKMPFATLLVEWKAFHEGAPSWLAEFWKFKFETTKPQFFK